MWLQKMGEIGSVGICLGLRVKGRFLWGDTNSFLLVLLHCRRKKKTEQVRC